MWRITRVASFAHSTLALCTTIVFLIACVTVVASGVNAQSTSATAGSAPPANAIVRGVVASATGEALQYAVVSIPALELQQFTNSAGRFTFASVRPGTYRVTIRQLGYTAVAIDVTVAANENRELSVKMERIVTRLATMQVSADPACRKPGPPSTSGNAELAEVFEQLEQNAVRMRLLSSVYPYDAVTERIRFLRHGDGLETIQVHDSVRTPNQQAARYRPGAVVFEEKSVAVKGQGAPQNERFMRIPTLLDFADSVFQANHCFYLRGIETSADGDKEVRVDFKPAESLKSPDVSGSVFLVPETYRLLRADIELTKIPKYLTGLLRVNALTFFGELVTGLPMIDEIVATSSLHAMTRMAPAQSIERLITLKVQFRKDVPDSFRSDTSAARQFHEILK